LRDDFFHQVRIRSGRRRLQARNREFYSPDERTRTPLCSWRKTRGAQSPAGSSPRALTNPSPARSTPPLSVIASIGSIIFFVLSFLPLFFCSVLFGERLATTERERERERERCSLQRDKSSRRAEGVPPGAPSKKRVTERERGRKFFFLSHILACCFFLLNRCPISFVVRLRASLFARTSSLSEREELPRARHHCLSLTL